MTASLYPEKCLSQRPDGSVASRGYSLSRWLPVSLTYRVVSNYILMTWLEEANIFGNWGWSVYHSLLTRRGRGSEWKEKEGGGGGLKFVRFVQSRSREWTSFFFSCNTRIKVNGSYFREIMKGQACLGSSLHLFRTLSFSL